MGRCAGFWPSSGRMREIVKAAEASLDSWLLINLDTFIGLFNLIRVCLLPGAGFKPPKWRA